MEVLNDLSEDLITEFGDKNLVFVFNNNLVLGPKYVRFRTGQWVTDVNPSEYIPLAYLERLNGCLVSYLRAYIFIKRKRFQT